MSNRIATRIRSLAKRVAWNTPVYDDAPDPEWEDLRESDVKDAIKEYFEGFDYRVTKMDLTGWNLEVVVKNVQPNRKYKGAWVDGLIVDVTIKSMINDDEGVDTHVTTQVRRAPKGWRKPMYFGEIDGYGHNNGPSDAFWEAWEEVESYGWLVTDHLS